MVSVGRYTLHGEIASGGMATVHFGRARDGSSRVVAIKCLRRELARDPEFVTMFMDEARLASRVRHPNVVPTIDVAEDGTFLVMEYVAGESLATLLLGAAALGEAIPIPIGIRILVDALVGLHAAHTAHDESGAPLEIVHRDVSPQNVIVGIDGMARVLDFGIAKATVNDHTTKDGRLKGKLRYMAPEQLKDSRITARTDTYAASVMLWELLTGEKLFNAGNDAAIVAQVLEGTVVPPSRVVPSIPKELDAITMRGLSRDPAGRFASALHLAEALWGVVTPASARDVAEWVEHIAGPVIAKRAERVARLEGSNTASLVLSDMVADTGVVMPAGTRTMERRDFALLPLHTEQVDTEQVTLPMAVSPMAVSPMAVPLAGPPPLPYSRSSRTSGLGVLLLFGFSLVVFAGGTVFYRHRAASDVVDVAPPPSAAAAAPMPPSAAVPTPVPSLATATAPTAVVMPVISSAAGDDAPRAPTPEAPGPPAKPVVAHAPPRASSHAHTKASTPSPPHTAAAKPDCSQHFYLDPTGIRRAKPECL